MLQLEQLIFGSSKSEHENLRSQGIPLTYEQKLKGDRRATILTALIIVVFSVVYSWV